MIHVIACETQPIVVEGLRKSLEDSTDLKLVGAVSDPKAFSELVAKELPKVCLIDKAFGTKAVFQLISELKVRSPETDPFSGRRIFRKWSPFGRCKWAREGF